MKRTVILIIICIICILILLITNKALGKKYNASTQAILNQTYTSLKSTI